MKLKYVVVGVLSLSMWLGACGDNDTTGEDCVCSSGDCCDGCQYITAGTECRAATDVCDVAETCSGTGNECPPDAYVMVGTECRAASGACDIAEVCDGLTTACPTDSFMTAETVCRASAGECDREEMCTGTEADCPTDEFVANTTVCRESTGVCDAPETCTGSDADCPTDALRDTAYECRAAASICDAPEYCDGSNIGCPQDVYTSQGTTCDASNVCSDGGGECDGLGQCIYLQENPCEGACGREADGGDGQCCALGFGGADCQTCVRFVDQYAVVSNMANLGLSWTDAHTDLQKALDAVTDDMATNGIARCQLWLAEGIYYPTKENEQGNIRSVMFKIPDGVELYGGFIGSEGALEQRLGLARNTIISGDLDGESDLDTQNAYALMTIDAGTDQDAHGVVIDSLRFQFAYADDFNYYPVFIRSGEVTMNNTLVDNNYNRTADVSRSNITVDNFDGGIVYVNQASLLVTDSKFFNNRAVDSNGGAIFCVAGHLSVFGSTFENNESEKNGGAIAAASCITSLVQNTFKENFAYSSSPQWPYGMGGAVYLGGQLLDINWTAEILDNEFTENDASRYGGALSISGCEGTYCDDWPDCAGLSCSVNVESNIVSNNEGGNEGGGIHQGGHPNVIYRENIITENQGSSNIEGAGLMVGGRGDAVIVDNIIMNNILADGGGGIKTGGPGKRIIVNNYVVGNRSRHGAGIMASGHSIYQEIVGNEVAYNIMYPYSTYTRGGAGIKVSGYTHNYIANNLVYGNFIYDPTPGNENSTGAGMKLAGYSSNTVVNNTVILNKQFNPDYTYGAGLIVGCESEGSVIANNIFWDNDSTYMDGTSYTVTTTEDAIDNPMQFYQPYIYNNIIEGSTDVDNINMAPTFVNVPLAIDWQMNDGSSNRLYVFDASQYEAGQVVVLPGDDTLYTISSVYSDVTPGNDYINLDADAHSDFNYEFMPIQVWPANTTNATLDFTLAAGSEGVDAADPDYADAYDFMGYVRAGVPDLGAIELGAQAGEAQSICNGYMNFGDLEFWYCEQPKTWEAANSYCHSMGASLVSFRDNELKMELLLGTTDFIPAGEQIWINMVYNNDQNETPRWTWYDHLEFISSVEFDAWADGEPHMDSGAAYLEVDEKLWYAADKYDLRPFVCETPEHGFWPMLDWNWND